METGFTQLKDTDRLILDATDDRTLLEILKVNRNLLILGEDSFKKRIQRSYPVLAKLKPYGIKWAKYYLDMVYYISKLKEDYDIDYIPVSSFDPASYYISKKNERNIAKDLNLLRDSSHMAEILAELGDETRIREWMNKYTKYKDFVLAFLLKYKNISLFEKLYVPNTKPVKYFNPNYGVHQAFLFLEEAAESGDIDIVNYVLKKFKSIFDHDELSAFNHLIIGSTKTGDIEMLSYITKMFPKQEIDFHELLDAAASKGQIDFIRSFIQPENKKILLKHLPNIIENLIYRETTEVQNPYKKEKTLKFLLDTYFSMGGKRKLINIVAEQEIIDTNTVRIFQEYGF